MRKDKGELLAGLVALAGPAVVVGAGAFALRARAPQFPAPQLPAPRTSPPDRLNPKV